MGYKTWKLESAFSCVGILRYLVHKGFVASVTGKKKVVGYKYGANWPAPASFFEIGPIGFVSVIQMWFRYYVKNHISDQMSEIETNLGSCLKSSRCRNSMSTTAKEPPLLFEVRR